jgi:hypothetical protein
MNDQSLTADGIAQATRHHHYETADQLEERGRQIVAGAQQLQADMDALIDGLSRSLRAEVQPAIEQAHTVDTMLKSAASAARLSGDEIVQRVAESLEKSAQAREIAKKVAEHYAE